MFLITLIVLTVSVKNLNCINWKKSDGILPWESYLKLGNIERPLGLKLDRNSLAHHHFAIGYLCLQSFMYDEAQDAFNLAINNTPTFIEPYIGKILACKHALWADTDFDCGLAAYNATQKMLTTYNVTPTRLQSALISTAYQWYKNTSSVRAGERAFLSSISNISASYPNETDIHVLWGLSLLNVAFDREFQGQIEPKPMKESREVLKAVLKKEPTHPGALHYLIHAFDVDDADVAEKATDYANTYNKTVLTLSHAQHMPAHIWMRTGAWLSAVTADSTALQVSLELCAIKILNRPISLSSIELEHVLKLFNTTNQTLHFLKCDAENRAHSTEWLAYSHLQTGNWPSSVAAVHDLVRAENGSLSIPHHYLAFAYRAQARTIVDIFFWFPYNSQFLKKIQPLLIYTEAQTLVPFGDDISGWYPIWSEAGYRFADSLQLLTNYYNDNNTSNNFTTIDNHLAHLNILANRTSLLSKYISNSILMMIPQLRGIHYYIDGSWQECLNELNRAVELESTLITGGNSPTLVFARSSELLAMHLLIIYEKYHERMIQMNTSIYKLNGSDMSVDKFPSIALDFYKQADHVAPNRAINTLGMARANALLNDHSAATSLFQQLFYQMTSSNNHDENFLKEVNDYLDKHNSTTKYHLSLFLIFLSMFFSMIFE